MPGPPPKPTALKELAGNPGHYPLNKAEIKPPVGAPEKPKGLGVIASREWDALVPQLLTLGLLTIIDGKALVEYCKAVEISELAYRDMRKHGLLIDEPVLDNMYQPIVLKRDNDDKPVYLVKHKKNPAVDAWKAANTAIKSFLAEFGLTPASRAKLKLPEKKKTDPMEDYLAGSGPVVSESSKRAIEEAKKKAPLAFKTGTPELPAPVAAPQPSLDVTNLPDTAFNFDS